MGAGVPVGVPSESGRLVGAGERSRHTESRGPCRRACSRMVTLTGTGTPVLTQAVQLCTRTHVHTHTHSLPLWLQVSLPQGGPLPSSAVTQEALPETWTCRLPESTSISSGLDSAATPRGRANTSPPPTAAGPAALVVVFCLGSFCLKCPRGAQGGGTHESKAHGPGGAEDKAMVGWQGQRQAWGHICPLGQGMG